MLCTQDAMKKCKKKVCKTRTICSEANVGGRHEHTHRDVDQRPTSSAVQRRVKCQRIGGADTAHLDGQYVHALRMLVGGYLIWVEGKHFALVGVGSQSHFTHALCTSTWCRALFFGRFAVLLPV
jgi:hypothetical protein